MTRYTTTTMPVSPASDTVWARIRSIRPASAAMLPMATATANGSSDDGHTSTAASASPTAPAGPAPRAASSAPTAGPSRTTACAGARRPASGRSVVARRHHRCTATTASIPTGHNGNAGRRSTAPHPTASADDVATDDDDPAEPAAAVGQSRAAGAWPPPAPGPRPRARRSGRSTAAVALTTVPCPCASTTASRTVARPRRGPHRAAQRAAGARRAAGRRRTPRPAAKASDHGRRTTWVARSPCGSDDRRIDRGGQATAPAAAKTASERPPAPAVRGSLAPPPPGALPDTPSWLTMIGALIARSSPRGRSRRAPAPRLGPSIRPSRMRTMRVAGAATLVVGDEQDRLAPGVEPAEQLEDLEAALGVQRPGRLVGQQQRRLVGQGAGDGQALTLPTREHPRRAPCLSARPSMSSRSRARLSAWRARPRR